MRTKAIIHLDRFCRNFQAVRDRAGPQRHICVPVKADAYGHGALKIAQTALEAGAFCLGVGTVTEGSELRKAGIKAPILLFTQPHPAEIPAVFDAGLTPFVSEEGFASALSEYSAANGIQRLPVHMKIDTGMGRMGCRGQSLNSDPASSAPALSLARHITSCPGLELAGTATHFADSDGDRAYTKLQTERFVQAVSAVKSAGIDPGIVHAANSGAFALHEDTWFDMVRPGLFLYGYDLSRQALSPNSVPKPEPVMELRTTVVLIKKIKKGESVSYGRTWTAPQDTFIGILPVGYADGFPRLASGRWQVVINGRAYPQIGRICMDQCCVDLGTELERGQRSGSVPKIGDEAVVFGGKEYGEGQDAAALAAVVETIPYEITCNISKRVPREYQN